MAVSPLAASAVAVAVLVTANLLNNRYARQAYLLTAPVTTAVLLGLYALAGGDPHAAGLGRAELGGGVRWGLAAAALIGLVYLVVALLPGTRRFLADERAAQASGRTIAFETLVRIPFGTVLLEEVAFRGVLYGLLRTAYGPVWATAVSAVLFGLWHVPVAGGLTERNPAVGATLRGGAIVPVTVVAMTLAGVVLCELQRRSGSLAAPALVHWAVNALGLVAGYVVTRRRAGSRADR
jgi:uncharacterized protein